MKSLTILRAFAFVLAATVTILLAINLFAVALKVIARF